MKPYIIPFEQLKNKDVELVGGKNASIGEMISGLAALGVSVPGGFATTSHAYRDFLAQDGLDERIRNVLAALDVDDVERLAVVGAQIRGWMLSTPFPKRLHDEILDAWRKMGKTIGDPGEFAVAVRSSATAEDLPEASFAGQQETFLNVRGEEHLMACVHEVYASLFNDRAISYRVHNNFDHSAVALSVGVQHMVRSDLGTAGVMFTLDTDSGFRDVVFITAAYGLGETVVQGAVNPDEFYVYKPALRAGRRAVLRKNLGGKAHKMIYGEPGSKDRVRTVDVAPADRNRFSLDEADIVSLAKQALTIEEHYGTPMDIEWGKDGATGKIYILQARPETVQSRAGRTILRFTLKGRSKLLISGRSIGQRIGAGQARIIKDVKEMSRVRAGDVLVADMTDPDWEPVMKRASAIVTNRGGRTCHAAIIARELGVPAVVGCGDATEMLKDGTLVTVSCAEGDEGKIYDGLLETEITEVARGELPELPLKITMNIGNPQLAFDFQSIPNGGVGLARLEFIINNNIGVHPRAILEYPNIDADLKKAVESVARGHASPRAFYIDKLAEGIATIAAAFYPRPVIVRLSDFKSNEYKKLIGGSRYEPDEEKPMMAFRGASRYIAKSFRHCFEMECEAMRRVRNEIGLTNVEIMVPFVRTLGECAQVIELLAENGLRRGDNGLRLIMMCEVPSNAVLAEQFLEHFDGFSIGSNDLKQVTLGLDPAPRL